MRFVVPVGLRQYGEHLCIAETLARPMISAAGADPGNTLKKLRRAIEHEFSYVHPRILAAQLEERSYDIAREEREVYRSSVYKWTETDGSNYLDSFVTQEIDILRRDLGNDMVQFRIPMLNAWTIERIEDDEEHDPIARILTGFRDGDWSIQSHRPLPTEFTLIDLEVTFTPVDLTRINPNHIWSYEYDIADLDGSSSLGTTPMLAEVAQLWEFPTERHAEESGFHEATARNSETRELTKLVDNERASAVIIVGPTRVGKTALVRHLVRSRAGQNQRKIWFADPPRIVSTAPRGGLWQQQAQDFFQELENSDAILYVGRVIEALDAGKYEGSDYSLAQFMKPLLSDRRLRVIAEATSEEWNDLEKRDVGFARTFTVLRLDDPPDNQCVRIIRSVSKRITGESDISFTKDAVSRAWTLQKRFSVEGSPVGRTIDFLERSARRAKTQYLKEMEEETLVEAFCLDTGLPPILLLDSRQLQFDSVLGALKRRVIGQDEAVEKVTNVVSVTKAGLYAPDKPLGSFMFVGPTGVGKTELAKSLAEFLFGSEDRLVRLDMSEYSHPDAYGRLIGEGREEGDLTAPVRREPFSVVLLDEIEKAHPSVYDVLLQVLGEARLTATDGRVTRFQNSIVIMTSNLGVESMRPAIGFGSDGAADNYHSHFRREAERFYRPEFLARIDQFIAFRPLAVETVTQIAERSLEKIAHRDGFIGQDIAIEYGEGVSKFLATVGYHEKYGARPLKREIEQRLVWKLAESLADTKDAAEAGNGRKIDVTLNERGDDLLVHVETVAPSNRDHETRTRLLSQVDRVSDLRRRLSTYMYTVLFGELEWELENFDLSSQSPQFWDDPRAAEQASNAERLRKVVMPAEEVANELASLEDLATEAYHTRSFEIATDVDERIDELEKRVYGIFIAAMNASYDTPHEAVMFIYTRTGNEKFRDQLIRWYVLWSERWNWDLTFWTPLAARETQHIKRDPTHRYDFDRKFWKEISASEATGPIVGLNFKGESARPLIRPEHGVHRYIASEGNAVVEVIVLEEHESWPFPEDAENARKPSFGARTYNFRTREVSMPKGYRTSIMGTWGITTTSAKLDGKDPLGGMEKAIVQEAWDLSVSDWE